jgi:predicted transcriptional regulator
MWNARSAAASSESTAVGECSKDNAVSKPEGNLTATQYEILRAVWAAGSAGATVAEIWQAIAPNREVGRTTVLNLVDRLEKRGWLARTGESRSYRYLAPLGQAETDALLARQFVDDFFEGSASNLLLSLLGSKRIRREDVEQLRRIMESTEGKRTRGGEKHGS